MILGGVGLFAAKGALRGFFRGAFGLLALWAGVAVPLRFGPEGRGEAGRWTLGTHFTRLVAYAALFMVPYAGLHLVGSILHRLGRAVFLGRLDRLAGAALGALTGALLMGAVVHALGAVGWGQGVLAHSRLASPAADGFHLALRWAMAR